MKKLALLLVVIAAGCISEGNYTKSLSKESCQRSRECFRAEFDDEYSDLNDCVEESTETLDDLDSCYASAGCDFDVAKAKACRKAIGAATCEDFIDGVDDDSCDEIYDCTSSQEAEVFACVIR